MGYRSSDPRSKLGALPAPRRRSIVALGGMRLGELAGGAYTCNGSDCGYSDCAAFESFAILQETLNDAAGRFSLQTIAVDGQIGPNTATLANSVAYAMVNGGASLSPTMSPLLGTPGVAYLAANADALTNEIGTFLGAVRQNSGLTCPLGASGGSGNPTIVSPGMTIDVQQSGPSSSSGLLAGVLVGVAALAGIGVAVAKHRKNAGKHGHRGQHGHHARR